MPLAVTFAEPFTLSVRASGAITFAEVERLIDELATDARIPRGVPVLADCRDVQATPSTAELKAIACDMRRLLDHGLGPVAIVTSSTFVYGVARMFSAFAEVMGATVSAFRTTEEANDWLSAQASTTG